MRKKDGFTLIEIILGMIIFSIMSVSLFSVFRNGVSIQNRAQEVEHIAKEIRWTLDQMDRDIASAVFYDFSQSTPDSRSFEGTTDSVTLIVFQDAQLWRVNYILEEIDLTTVNTTIIGGVTYKPVAQTFIFQDAQTQYQLVRQIQPLSEFLKGVEDNIEREVLCARLVEPGLVIDYATFSKDQAENQDIQWVSEWGEIYFPQAVRVQLKYGGLEDAPPTVYQRHILIPASKYYYAQADKGK